MRIGMLLLGSSLVLTIWWWQLRKSAALSTQTQTEAPQRRTIVNKRVITGNLVPHREATLKAQMPGILEKCYVDIGQQVKEGTPIARIKAVPKADDVALAQKALHMAQATQAHAEAAYKRNEALYKKKMLSLEQYEHSLKTWKVACEEATYAQRHLDLLVQGHTTDVQYKAHIIRSTISGVVAELPCKEGTVVMEQSAFKEGSTIALICDMSTLRFQGEVGEMDVPHLHKGMQFDISLNALPGKTFRTTLTQIAPKAIGSKNSKEKSSVKFAIKGTIQISPQDKAALRAGYTAMADIVLAQAQDVLAVKEQWVKTTTQSVEKGQQEETVDYVWVAENGKPVKRPVKLGVSDGIYVEIKEGLAITDQIITAHDKH